jgi:hypothetical protein
MLLEILDFGSIWDTKLNIVESTSLNPVTLLNMFCLSCYLFSICIVYLFSFPYFLVERQRINLLNFSH